ncbi:MAG: membrane protein insertase YidC [Alphaproteobacteria bacterium]|nr:membrane protein insertase YidC [Alphaproteobacteria bacterium]
MGDDNRNFIVAFGLIMLILLGYQIFVMGPAAEQRREELAAEAALEQADPDLPTDTLTTSGAAATIDRPEALAQAERIIIDAPSVEGSISLTGARFDDLRLRNHTTEVDSDELVSLLNPIGADHVFYARDGWQSITPGVNDLPGGATNWALISGDVLTPDTPIVLGYESESGLAFERTISINENYLFTITDNVTNTSSDEVELQRYGLVRQEGLPEVLTNNMAVFEGAIAVIDGAMVRESFNALEDGASAEESGLGGWVGITTRYWLTAAIPDLDTAFTARFRTIERGENDAFEASYVERAQVLAPGASLSDTTYIFAGAKELDVLHYVEDNIGVQNFDMAYNWGWLWFLVRPFVWALHMLEGMLGDFGLAILALTLAIKILMFPLANRAYASMARMKIVQPKMQEIRERYASDTQKQQQAMMELYRKEKINPLAGCLPILPQIPIFFALYQTLFNALEMRHAPFFGWIRDMSAADPTNIWNLFGLLPYDPSGWFLLGGILGIGAWPVLMGITMWAQQALNPPPPDPMQARIFAFLPIVFTFILAPFAAGLVIYWAWNNFLSVLQQYVIMRRHGNETQLDKLINRLRGKASENES